SVRFLRCWSEANDGPRERPSAPRERALDAEGGEELDRRVVGVREEVVRVEDVVGGDRRRSDTARAEVEDRDPVLTARATAQLHRALDELLADRDFDRHRAGVISARSTAMAWRCDK